MVATTDPIETNSPNNYLDALSDLVQNVIAATNEATSLCQASPLFLEPKHYIYFYYGWLEFVINQKVIGDKKNLTNLMKDTIRQHSIQGKNFFKLVRLY